MAAKTPAAKKRKIVQENRIQGRGQGRTVRSADGAR